MSWKPFASLGFPLGLINKKLGVALSKKNDPILSLEANDSSVERICSLGDFVQVTRHIKDYISLSILYVYWKANILCFQE